MENQKKRHFSNSVSVFFLTCYFNFVPKVFNIAISKAALNEFVLSIIHFITYSSWSAIEFGKHAHAQMKYQGDRKTTKILEPVSSTSRRGARAAYHDEYPRDFGPRIAYTVS